MTTHCERIPVSIHAYDPAEFERWCAGEPGIVDPLVAKVGAMGRSPGVIWNQLRASMQAGRSKPAPTGGGYNYAEVRFAGHLVDEGWNPEGIIYENFRLSSRACGASKGLLGAGCERVRQSFTDVFFARFDALVVANPDLFKKKRDPLESTVDLFAADPANRRVGLWEVKRFNEKTGGTESIGDHQRAVLAFVSYLAREKPGVRRDPAVRVHVGLEVFVPARMTTDGTADRAVHARDRECSFVIPAS